MPIYEYEPADHDCLMCDGRVRVIQGINDEPLRYCPDCGLPVRRVISAASFKISSGGTSKAGDRGFTTWKKVESGTWEKVSGPGVDVIKGDPADVQAIKQEPKPAKVIDLDKP